MLKDRYLRCNEYFSTVAALTRGRRQQDPEQFNGL